MTTLFDAARHCTCGYSSAVPGFHAAHCQYRKLWDGPKQRTPAEIAADEAENERWGAGSAPGRTRGGRIDG